MVIYDYLDKWLTERCRIMEILLSYEIHKKRHVGFGDHLICWRAHLSAQSDAQGSCSPVIAPISFQKELASYSQPQTKGSAINGMQPSISAFNITMNKY